MIDSIHQSMLSMALRCGEQFRRRYGLGEIIPPSIAAARGTGVHRGNRVNLEHKLIKGDDLPVDDVRDATRDGYVGAFERAGGEVFLPKEDRPAKKQLLNEGLNDALRMIELYHAEVAPGIHPVGIEEPFHIDVGLALPLAGQMDFFTVPEIGDLKTTTKKWAEGQINQEIQPPFYCLAHEFIRKVRPRFDYHILIARRGKTGPTSAELQEQSMVPTENNYRALLSKIKVFLKMVETGTFPPANPGAWWCDEKWCGYWASCPHVGN